MIQAWPLFDVGKYGLSNSESLVTAASLPASIMMVCCEGVRLSMIF